MIASNENLYMACALLAPVRAVAFLHSLIHLFSLCLESIQAKDRGGKGDPKNVAHFFIPQWEPGSVFPLILREALKLLQRRSEGSISRRTSKSVR